MACLDRFHKFTCAAALVDTTVTSTHAQEVPQPRIQPFSDPQFFITALLSSRNIIHIRQVHALAAVNEVLQNLTVSSKLLYMYLQHKILNDAYALFSQMEQKNAVSWSVMVGGFVKGGDYSNGFRTFREIIRCRIPPDNYTLPFVIRACRDLMDLKIGRMIHDVVLKHGLLSDNFVCAALVDIYVCKM